jgi:hypothetical protein
MRKAVLKLSRHGGRLMPKVLWIRVQSRTEERGRSAGVG